MTRRLRSQDWFDNPDHVDMTALYLERYLNYGLTRDLYVSLGEALDESTWIVRVHHKPFVNWIWIGCLLMAFGGLLAASDRRYRVGVRAADSLQNPGAKAAAQPA